MVRLERTDSGSATFEWVMRGTNRAPLRNLPPTGATIALPGVDLITARDGRLTSVRGFFDRQGFLEQIGAQVVVQPYAVGFLGFVGAVAGRRMYTITAWSDPEAPRQLMRGGTHREAVRRFFAGEWASQAHTSIWAPARINRHHVRCGGCGAMSFLDGPDGRCACGASLPERPAFW